MRSSQSAVSARFMLLRSALTTFVGIQNHWTDQQVHTMAQLTDFAWCESSAGHGVWHVRALDGAGLRPSGGITTPSLCGVVTPAAGVRGTGGWDRQVPVVLPSNKDGYCSLCLRELQLRCVDDTPVSRV